MLEIVLFIRSILPLSSVT